MHCRQTNVAKAFNRLITSQILRSFFHLIFFSCFSLRETKTLHVSQRVASKQAPLHTAQYIDFGGDSQTVFLSFLLRSGYVRLLLCAFRMREFATRAFSYSFQKDFIAKNVLSSEKIIRSELVRGNTTTQKSRSFKRKQSFTFPNQTSKVKFDRS